MDPDACLEEMLELAEQLAENDADMTDSDDAARLGELVSGLNAWIVNGGALPAAWAR